MATPNKRTTPPKTKVSLDLDKFDGEADPVKPFTARLKGKVFTFADPGDMEYFELTSMPMNVEGERTMLNKLLGEQVDDFMECRPTTRQVMQLFEAWREHYGMLDPGEAPASVASSNGTA
jgi:hypothetical protein